MKRLALFWWLLCAVHQPVAAHVLDQYLQVAQIALAPEGVSIELRLIPGAQAADCVFALIDANRDGQLSMQEQQAYAQRVRQDLALTINQQPVPLILAGAQFPERAAMNEGLGTIRLTFTAKAVLAAANEQQLDFQNRHLPTLSVYLVNALVPASDAIKITGQQRDALQHGLELNFHAKQSAARMGWRWLGVLLGGLCLVLIFRFKQRRQQRAGEHHGDVQFQIARP